MSSKAWHPYHPNSDSKILVSTSKSVILVVQTAANVDSNVAPNLFFHIQNVRFAIPQYCDRRGENGSVKVRTDGLPICPTSQIRKKNRPQNMMLCRQSNPIFLHLYVGVICRPFYASDLKNSFNNQGFCPWSSWSEAVMGRISMVNCRKSCVFGQSKQEKSLQCHDIVCSDQCQNIACFSIVAICPDWSLFGVDWSFHIVSENTDVAVGSSIPLRPRQSCSGMRFFLEQIVES